MCGIAGYITPLDAPEDRVRRMADALRHRGPDDIGVWCDANAGVALGHARLSVLDLSQCGHQPMHSAGGRYTLVFNGEIYNHLALRAELEGRVGSKWRGRADTETILAGFETWGVEETVRKSVGMFAFAVWDKHARTLTLVRDRLGEKPLYYGWRGSTFLFGSELKALKAHPAFDGDIDRDSLAAFMRYAYVPSPHSIYVGIRKLPAGTSLTIGTEKPGDPQPKKYWSLADAALRGQADPFVGSDAEAIDQLEARLSEAVELQKLSDVPLGALLSGGVDSSLITALLQANSAGPVHSFTIGMHGGRFDEAAYARAVAEHLGTDHTELYVTADDARNVIPRLPTMYDEPFADSSQIPTFLVSQLARSRVTVSLSGDGGDELFGGYNRYLQAGRFNGYPQWLRNGMSAALTALSPAQWNRMHKAAGPLLPRSFQSSTPGDHAQKLAAIMTLRGDRMVYQRLVSTWTEPADLVLGVGNVGESLPEWDELEGIEAPQHRMMAVDALTYLPDDVLCKVDRAAMGVSLETRVPFLDHRVVEYAWQLPLHMKLRNGQGKWILRQLLYKFVPRKLVERPKMGFDIPIGAWLRGPLRDWAEDLLAEDRLRHEGFLSVPHVRQAWKEHLIGNRNREHHIWNVLMFQAWLANQPG